MPLGRSWLGVFLLGGCNAILGIEDRNPRDAGPAPSDAGPVIAAPEPGPSGVGHPYRDAVLADGPKAYYRFGEASGLSVADEMGGAAGTYPTAGITLAAPGALASERDTATTLDGTARISFPGVPIGTGLAAFTVELWVRRTGSDTAFIVDQNSYPPRSGWDLASDDQGVYFERWAGTPHDAIGTSKPLPAGEWHYVVATWDGTNRRLFVDAQLLVTTESGLKLPARDAGWTVGAQNCDCHASFFTGSLDELALYDKALTDTRIKAHYAAATGTSP